MLLISNRGNITGENKAKQNSVPYIMRAIQLGYDVKIDIWHVNNRWYLGKEKPNCEVPFRFFYINKNMKYSGGNCNKALWIQCQNIHAFNMLIPYRWSLNYFFKNDTNMLFTSFGYIWSSDRINATHECVLATNDYKNVPTAQFGLCTDYVLNLKENR